MKGQHTARDRTVFTGSGYKATIGIVIAIAIALVALLLVFLPAIEEQPKTERSIVSIENTAGNIGIESDLNKIFVAVTYSDGTVENVSIASMTHEGLDVRTAGEQNLSLSYGGFEQVIPVKVVSIDCVLQYNASVGGRVQGEKVQSIRNGGDAATVIAVPETGYVFAHWNDGFPYASRKDYGITENKTYIAIFEKAQYTVRFYYDEGTIASEEKVTYGEAPTKVPNIRDDIKMKKYGYTFSNWVPMDFSVIDRNMIIRPEYVKTATDVIVSIPDDQYGNVMGATNARKEGYYAHNSFATITATPFNSREFAYWLVETSSGEYMKVDRQDNKTYSIGTNNYGVNFQSTTSGSSVADYVLSFYATDQITQVRVKAIFAYSQSSVTFINYQNPLNNNVEITITGLPFNSSLLEYETETISFKEGMPEPAKIIGMQFLGWYLDKDASQTIVNTEIKFEQPAKLIAKWKKLQYDIIFNYTNELGTIIPWHSTKVTYQDTFASGTRGGLPLSNPTLKNYIFVGWEDALTHKTVDDKTKLYAQAEYVDNIDFKNQKLYMVPVWTPVPHELFVNIDGSGKVILVKNEGKIDTNGVDLSQRIEDIRGNYTIYETDTYTLYFEALTGFELKSLRWSYSDTVKVDNFDTDGLNNKIIYVDHNFDNDILVSFGSIKYGIAVTNGSYTYTGLLRNNAIAYDSLDVNLEISYNSTLELFVESTNGIYAISDIIISGKANGTTLVNSSLKAYLEEDTLSYTLVLDKCLSNITIIISYATREYVVNVASYTGGTIEQVDFFNMSNTTAVDSQTTFTYGERVVYKITATDSVSIRKYLSNIRINGSKFDLYTAMHDSVRFFNWENNQVSQGISALNINGNYYYGYGSFTYNFDNYIYCEGFYSKSTHIFSYSGVLGEDTIFLPVEESFAGYETLLSVGKTALDINNRSVYSTQVVKDNRITTVYIMLIITENFNLSFSFSDIYYNVSVNLDDKAVCLVSNTQPTYKQTSTVTVTPITGYYITGYIKNNGNFEAITTAKKGDSYSKSFENIAEDISLTFVYEPISFELNFTNNNANEVDVTVNGNLLNNSYSIVMEYHSAETFVINILTANKRITVLKINDVEQTIHYNMTSYTYVVSNVNASVNIDVWCGNKTNDNMGVAPQYSLNIQNEYVMNTTVSAQYITCETSQENVLRVVADKGYKITTVTITGSDGLGGVKALPFDIANAGKTMLDITIPGGYFATGEVNVTVTASQDKYTLTKNSVGNGTIGASGFIYHGETVEIIVSAEANNYISSFKINGEAVSFSSSNWSNLSYNSSIKKYNYGIYSFIATENVTIETIFAINGYDVVVDSASIGGNTILSVDGRGVVTRALYGDYLNISMSANTGYHISAIYINSILVTDYVLKSQTENANTTDAYIYKGKKVGANFSGISEKTIVRVVYEINHYSFKFTLTNASENFALDTGAGSLTSVGYTLSGNEYKGIEHGSNFSIDLAPTLGNGYYVYSVYIKYKSAYSGESEEVTRYFSDPENIVNYKGGTIWFNRFMGFEEGATANIELINVTFKRNLYAIDLQLSSLEGTGTMDINYTNRSNINSDVILVSNFGDKYYYRTDNKIYTKQGGNYLLTDIALVYDAISGKYMYRSGANQVFLLVEHGLQYTVFVRPTIGYQRTAFLVNNEDKNSLVFDNKYFVNLTRDTVIAVEYTILTYTITYSTTVIDKNLTGKISNALIKNYMDISIKNVGNGIVSALAFGADKITITANYGTRLQFISLAKFGTTGYYLYTMFVNDEQVTNYNGSIEDNAIYGGANYEEGLIVTENINVRVSYRIKRYTVSTSISYAENIVNESANIVREESSDTIPWGDAAYIKVSGGIGYTLDAISVRRGTNPYNYVILNPSGDIINNLKEQMYYNAVNQNTNERRDVLKVVEVKSNITVVVYFVRKEFTLRYVINNVENLNNVVTTLNAYNSTYPLSNTTTSISTGTWENGNINILNIKYYDEISAIFMPKNGYKIKELLVTVRAIRWDSDLAEWVAVLDNDDRPIVYTINYTETYNDSRSFTFHNPSSPIAMYNVKTDLEISFTVVVKTYTIANEIYRGNGLGNNNETAITMSVTNALGENIILPNQSYQYSQILTPTNRGLTYIAEHHGFITYNFDVANGYMLKSLSLNGFVWDNFKTASINDIYYTYSAIQKTDVNGYPYYTYSIRIPVVDRLLSGRENFIKGEFDIYVNMEIVPIAYQIKVFINGVNYQASLVGGKTTVTDGSTLKVYTPENTTHFSLLAVEPDPLVGYKVTGLNVRIGNASDALYDAGFTIGDYNIRKNFSINSSNLTNSSVLQDKLTIYIYYTSVIKTYQVNIGAYAYSYDTALVGEGNNENTIGLDTVAGKVTVTPTTTNNTVLPYNGVGLFEYFVNVRYEAYASEDYSIYLVEEYVWVKKDTQGNDVYEWISINNGLRGLSYNVVTSLDGRKTHIINYMVDDYGNRQFRVIFKQKTTITVHVTSPYKYVSGTVALGMMNYNYYATVNAKENGATIVSSYNNGTNVVIDTYVYNVYVGNYISLSYRDSYPKTGETGYSFRTLNGANYVIDSLVVTEKGALITGSKEYYLFTDVFARITFEKENNGANQASEGGSIVFNNAGSEPTNRSIYTSATITGKTVNITVKPNANFIFTEMQVHQIDIDRSKKQGKIVYLTGAEEWLTFDPSTFSEQDTNKFDITRTIDAGTGYINYRVIMRGDMELRFVFYRVYEIEYTANFTDKTAINGGTLNYYNPKNTYSYINYSEEYDNVAINTGTNYKVSYNSSFKLTALPAPSNYVFVGWYVNGVNTYEYLSDALPGNDYTVNYFYINIDDMGGLIINNSEVTKLTFMAMYQPVLTVGLINELYYNNQETSQWNSWQSGALDASAYNFDGSSVPEGQIDNKVINTSFTSVSNTKTIFNNKLPAAVSSANWSLFEGVSNSNNIYSHIEVINLLYQNILDYEFVKNSWINGKILLNMTALSTTVHFTNWQYYNWNSGKYEDITYTYTDSSYGFDSQGNPVNITCFYEYYKFDMSYLYSGHMPYATCSDSVNNSNNTLPLIIRPNLWKSVTVDLTRSTYTNYLGGTLTKNFSSIIAPTIDRNSIINSTELHTSTSDDGLKGEYDYGATIKIMYYSNVDSYGKVLDYTAGGIKYRFIGWFLNWKVNNQTEFRLISDDDNMAGYNFNLTYKFGDEPPNDSIELRATYITQYKQSLFSYNIAGGNTYSTANSGGNYSVKDAPIINTNLNAKTVQFAFYNMTTGVVTSIAKYETRTNITDLLYAREFYIDVGTNYTISLDFTQKGNAESLYAVTTGPNMSRFGYDPNYDKQFKILKDNVDTGTGVTFTGEDKVATSIYKLDVQYYTKAKITFTNVMYKSGIKVPLNIANNLVGSAINMTVWDMDTNAYGDGNIVADGKISMIVKLNENGVNYHGSFDYAPYGFKNGYGIAAVKNIVYSYYNSSGQLKSCDSMLFNPANETYRKAITIDYTDGYMRNGSLLFGNPAWSTPSTKYTVANVGDGTETSPYRIYNAAQLQNLGIFFNYNNFSCINEQGHKVFFRLFDDIMLQTGITTATDGSLTPYGNSKAWVPICYHYDEVTREHKGFDGVLMGGDENTSHSIDGLAANGMNNLTPINDETNPLARFDYTNLAGYGIFGCINGGIVENIKIGNAYISMNTFVSAGASGSVSYVGVLAAKVYNATISNIVFEETAQVLRYSNATYGVARVYINAMDAIGAGLLAGYVQDSNISDITVKSNSGGICIEILGGSNTESGTGGIIGQYFGIKTEKYALSSLALKITNAGIVLINYRDGQRFTNSGGLVGFANGGNVDINDSTVSLVDNNSKLYIGNTMSINVGGVIGRMNGSTLTLMNTKVTSNGAVNTTAASSIKAEFSQGIGDTKEQGISLTASSSADIAGESMGSGGNSEFGKAGTLVGLNQFGVIKNNVSLYTINGGVYFYAGTAGGIVGVNSGGTVKDFELYTRNGDPSTFKMYFRMTTSSYSSYGGIAGANLSWGVIDNCSFVNSEATKSSGVTSLGGTFLYVFRKDNNNDIDYRTVYDHDIEILNGKKLPVIPNILTVGGIVGYNTSGVFNSFIKRSRITVNYHNGAATSDYQWIVRTGGIVGFHNAKAGVDDGMYYGNGMSNYPIGVKYLRRIQSCYTVGMSIVLLGHIWMENYGVIQNQAGYITNKTAATIGGIVGATNDSIIGQYAISNCYTLNNRYVLNFSAWGYTNHSDTAGENNVGWYHELVYEGITGSHRATPNRVGFDLDGNIFGICSGYNFSSGGSYANYCWSQGNSAERNTTVGKGYELFSQKVGLLKEKDLQYINKRGIDFSGDNSFSNILSFWMPAFDNTGAQTLFYAMPNPIMGEITVGSTSINVSPTGAEGMTQPLYVGGFVGFVGGWDGRVYRTDPSTGLLVMWHAEADLGTSTTCYYGSGVNSQAGNAGYNYYKDCYNNNGFLNDASNLVRGQKLGTAGRLNNSTYAAFESY